MTILKSLILVTFAINTFAFAGEEKSGTRIIFQNDQYVYLRTPGYLIRTEKSKRIQKKVIAKVGSFLKANNKKIVEAMGLNGDSKMITEVNQQIEQCIVDIQRSLNSSSNGTGPGANAPDPSNKRPWFLPSAYLFVIGAKLPNINGSSQVAIIAMPVQYTYIDKESRKVTQRIFLEFGGSLLLNFDVKNKQKSTPGLRIGGGLIWGKLESPDQFVGGMAGFSATTSLGNIAKFLKGPLANAGINFKVGALKQRVGDASYNPFVILSYARNAKPEFNGYINVGAALPLGALFEKFFNDANTSGGFDSEGSVYNYPMESGSTYVPGTDTPDDVEDNGTGTPDLPRFGG